MVELARCFDTLLDHFLEGGRGCYALCLERAKNLRSGLGAMDLR